MEFACSLNTRRGVFSGMRRRRRRRRRRQHETEVFGKLPKPCSMTRMRSAVCQYFAHITEYRNQTEPRVYLGLFTSMEE